LSLVNGRWHSAQVASLGLYFHCVGIGKGTICVIIAAPASPYHTIVAPLDRPSGPIVLAPISQTQSWDQTNSSSLITTKVGGRFEFDTFPAFFTRSSAWMVGRWRSLLEWKFRTWRTCGTIRR